MLSRFKEFMKHNRRNIESVNRKVKDQLNGNVVERNPTFVFHPTIMGPLNTMLYDVNNRRCINHLVTFED